jgi:hypothetical protein
MTRSIFEVLAQAVDGDAGDLADHALGELAGTDVALALELGWASLPPTLAAQLTPPSAIAADLDAGPSDVLAAVLVHPPEPVADIAVDERWGAGSDELDSPPVDHDPGAAVEPTPAWATHDLDDELTVTADTHHDANEVLVTDEPDDDGDPDDPWDDALL